MGKLAITTPGRTRPRRLRRTQAIRDLVAETHIVPSQFIVPRFVLPADKADEPIPSLPGLSQLGIENLLSVVEDELKLGIRAVLLFGHPEAGAKKTPDGQLARDPNFEQMVLERRLDQAGIDLPRPAGGTYYVRYRARDADGFVGPFTTPQRFEVIDCIRVSEGGCMRTGDGEPLRRP